jgi:hypothetical protein
MAASIARARDRPSSKADTMRALLALAIAPEPAIVSGYLTADRPPAPAEPARKCRVYAATAHARVQPSADADRTIRKCLELPQVLVIIRCSARNAFEMSSQLSAFTENFSHSGETLWAYRASNFVHARQMCTSTRPAVLRRPCHHPRPNQWSRPRLKKRTILCLRYLRPHVETGRISREL